MIGHHRPINARSLVVTWLAAGAVAFCAGAAAAAQVDVRLRISWGSGAQAPQKWSGAITAPDSELSNFQPLGIEPDEARAVQLVGSQVLVDPIVRRLFDGCDVSIRGDEASLVTIRLRNAADADAKEVQVALGELAARLFQAPLDERGGYLLVQRAPGDRLRVRIERDHLVLAPGETLALTVDAELNESTGAPRTLQASLRSVSGGAVLWQSDLPLPDDGIDPVSLELPAPAAEGAYRLSLIVPRPGSFADKLTPWEQNAPLAARDVEFVVIDPHARLQRLTNQWEVVHTIDPPTSSKWWQRVPAWTQLDRLPGLSVPRSLGNVKPFTPPGAPAGVVELPAQAAGAESHWQAYPLSVAAVGEPHAVEIDLPAGQRQQLAISIVEPDAAGRVTTFGRDASLYYDGGFDAAGTGGPDSPDRRRLVFWPRTTSPLVLLANHSPKQSAQYGTIRLLRRKAEPATPVDAAPPAAAAPPPSARLVAAYLGSPRLAQALGAARQLDGDPANGMCVDGWGTFLDAASRLAQQLRADGFNAAVVCVAADGGSLAPIDALGAAPTFDTGLLADNGADPMKKDVLEALLRVFDREGLRLVPVIELSAPLPALETLRRREGASGSGVDCVGADGRTWSEHHPGEATGPHYNLLDPRVQEAVAGLVDAVVKRYESHPAFGGVGVELAGSGYGTLPGAAWPLDDATIARFAKDAKIVLPTTGEDRFQKRVVELQGPRAAQWSAWRKAQLTNFYAALAARLRAHRPEIQLVLCTENLFSGPEATQRLRQAVNGQASLDEAAAELGVDLPGLAAAPGVCLLRPHRLASDEALQARALDLQLNSAVELDRALASQPRSGELLYHTSRRLRLPSFDVQSPFGAERTRLALNAPGAPRGDVAQQPTASALARRDFFTLVEGGELLSLVTDDAVVRQRRLFQQLPAGDAEVRVERRQPVALRVYRQATATTVCLINDSPWPVDVQLPLESPTPTAWRDLEVEETGVPAIASAVFAPPPSAVSQPGEPPWRLTLPPYGIAARRYESRSLRVGALAATVNEAARAALTARIDEIEQRVRNLAPERAYPQLQNPDFEQVSLDSRMPAWQPRVGKLGSATIDDNVAHFGVRALHLASEDALGVAAQSELFPIPATGQLVVRARVRTTTLPQGSRVYAWIEYEDGGAMRRPAPQALCGQATNGEWTLCEVAFDSLPMAAAGNMRIQFHLAGPGEAWVDAVELFDLRFDDNQTIELAKGLFAAKADLEAGLLVDCLRRVESYWPRYLVESQPATPTMAIPGRLEPHGRIDVATRPDDVPATPAAVDNDDNDDDGGVRSRIRNLVPKIIRR